MASQRIVWKWPTGHAMEPQGEVLEVGFNAFAAGSTALDRKSVDAKAKLLEVFENKGPVANLLVTLSWETG